MSTRTLYEITGDYLRLLEMLEEEENIDHQTFVDTLEGIEGEFEDKADNYARIIKELNAESEKFKSEIKRMTAKMNKIKNNSERLKNHLYERMKSTEKTTFKTDLFSFNIQKNGGVQPIEIVPGIEIPDAFCKKEPDNDKIRKALKNGVKLPFAVLKERGDHLVIR